MLGKIDIFADCSTLEQIENMASRDEVKGFTTNPTLIRKGGTTNYINFAKESSKLAKEKSISLEILSDDENQIIDESLKLSAMSDNIFVKIPIYNSLRQNLTDTILRLLDKKVKVNVTAVFLPEQVERLLNNFQNNSSMIISVFCGRISDTGRSPFPILQEIKKNMKNSKYVSLLWASTREIYNIVEAVDAKCDKITLNPELIDKLNLIGKDLIEFSHETSQMFKSDAEAAGFYI